MENRQTQESSRKDEPVSPLRFGPEKVVYVDDQYDDEINLGEFFGKLIDEWKTITAVMLVGLTLSIAALLYLPKAYLVEAVVRLPYVSELGSLRDQNLVAITPDIALARFVDQLTEPKNQLQVFEKSSWFQELSEENQLTSSQIFSDIRNNIAVSRVSHKYYELEKAEKTPFKEVRLSLISSAPEQVAGFFQELIKQAHTTALTELTNDIVSVKKNKILIIQNQLKSLTLAADDSRNAEIKRLEEANEELITGFQMQILLQIQKAKKDRENLIIQVGEALTTAKALEIINPVTWDDLRISRKSSQITNEFGGTDNTAPLYFQGTRILSAELNRLRSRQDDKPFIDGLVDLEKKINELKNDPKIAMLKARLDDSIYIEKYDELRQEYSRLTQTVINFDNVHLALVTQEAVISPNPTRDSKVFVLVGVFISAIVGLFIGFIRASMRNRKMVTL